MKNLILSLFVLSLFVTYGCSKDEEVEKGCEFYDILYCDERKPQDCIMFTSAGRVKHKTTEGSYATTDCIKMDTNFGNIYIIQATNKALQFEFYGVYTYVKK